MKNVIFAHAIEMTALVWLFPLQRSELEATVEEKADTQTNRFIILNGKSIPLEIIRSVKSAEHYLVVTTHARTSEYRARMKDFLGQVTHEDGIQIHRSFWVAKEEALELAGAVVHTQSGEALPVSRGRHPEVKEWFGDNRKPH
ncbi:hypothetical protein GCM10011517_00170 [Actibacterium pelagium]|uniref:HTH LytTR-type domain-containing protein n=1 Tax=Actibacterium pelagium TaxID=2029103 RepID=A0A917A8X7_9RHOB|nr:hypothetical protein GCM10011517_00170 [Actibacterium pelagium]